MSAVRRTDKRHSVRKANASPYTRPAPKKSSWSLTGILSLLNPMRFRSSAGEEEPESSSASDVEASPSTPSEETQDAAQKLTLRGRQMAQDVNINRIAGHSHRPPPPLSPVRQLNPFTFGVPSTPIRSSASFPLPTSTSPAQNLETVTTFLTEHRGKPMSDIEVEGLVSLIKKSTPAERHEPFRFSSTTPSTPNRGNSPLTQSSSLPSLKNQVASSSTTPRRTLAKNPNGVYRWQGGGSAKKSRNRYQSPAFGPSRSTSERLKLSSEPDVPPVPRLDSKRRRVGEDAATSSAVPGGSTTPTTPSPPPRASAPGPSPTRAAQAYPFPVSNGPLSPSPTLNGTPSLHKTSSTTNTPRLRATIPSKPTTPAIPSPLRQAWSQPQDPLFSPTQQPSRPTKAANYMTELIKEVTPPKRPDVSNPYQTASPVKIPSGTTKPRPKRPRATGRPTVPGKGEAKMNGKGIADKAEKVVEKKLEDYSPQAIIEATLPKGSKRSRPTDLRGQSVNDRAELAVSRDLKGHGEDVAGTDTPREDEADGRASKRSRGSSFDDTNSADGGLNGSKSGNRTATQLIPPQQEKVVEMTSERPPTLHSGTSNGIASKPSVLPITLTPSALGTPTPNNSPISPSSAISKSLFGVPKQSSIPKEPSKLRFSYQPETSDSIPPTPKLAPAQIPVLQSQPKVNGDTASPVPAPEVKEQPRMVLPSVAAASRGNNKVDAKVVARDVPKEKLPVFVFTFTGVQPQGLNSMDLKARNAAIALPQPSLPTFDFIAETNTTKATNMTSIVLPAASIKGFDWAAAGMTMPNAANNTRSSWTCQTCMLSNPATATDKCTICDTPR